MSETYGFGYYDGEQGDEINPPVPEPNQTIKALRAKADADSQALKEMREELNRLRQRARQADVAEVLKSKGYDPDAAKLYQGEPDKVDEWLTSYGSLLAKTPAGGAAVEPVTPQGPPASTVSAESQAEFQRMQTAGGEETAPLGSQDELAAALRATTNPADFQKVAQANGWNYTTDGLFG
jgi:hypothetical protein